MSLWVPPRAYEELREQTRAYVEQEIQQAVYSTPVSRVWNRELRKLDPYLRLVRANDNAQVANIVPGYYHLLRIGDAGVPMIQPLMGPQGQYLEPGSWMLDMLRSMDAQNPQVTKDRMLRQAREQERLNREREQDEADRRTEISERVDSATKTRVAFSPDVPWTQNVAGKRGTRK